MINLGSPILSRQGHIANQMVGLAVEQEVRRQVNDGLTHPALESGGLENSNQQKKRNKKPEFVQ